MATAGDDFLRKMLGNSENTPLTMSTTTTGGSGQPTAPPTVPASQRGDQAQADIDAETRRVRDQEMQRVENGPPPSGRASFPSAPARPVAAAPPAPAATSSTSRPSRPRSPNGNRSATTSRRT
jgi:hypothetical protein